ncbi:MAG: hypothetical protein LH468_07760 [Nocardioides sp.]|nr:hypothetical protein [Nocardioides sp.]
MDASDDELQHRLAELEARLAGTEIERAHERLRHREYALGLMLENEALKDKNVLLARRVKRNKLLLLDERRAAKRREAGLRESLEQVYASRTWKIGRVVATPLRGRNRP